MAPALCCMPPPLFVADDPLSNSSSQSISYRRGDGLKMMMMVILYGKKDRKWLSLLSRRKIKKKKDLCKSWVSRHLNMARYLVSGHRHTLASIYNTRVQYLYHTGSLSKSQGNKQTGLHRFFEKQRKREKERERRVGPCITMKPQKQLHDFITDAVTVFNE